MFAAGATGEAWEEYLAAHCPQYLLPAACRRSLPIDVAERLLACLTGRPGQLDLLRYSSLLSARIEALERLAHHYLPTLCRVLPSTSITEQRLWDGGYQGRLDVRATMAWRIGGDRTHFVTRSRRRSFDLPENVLVRQVARQLVGAIELLRERDIVADRGWGASLLDCEGRLRHALVSTALARVPSEPIGGRHLQAAQRARHPCYEQAAAWHRWFEDATSNDAPSRLARIVADGALAPVSPDRRFELAVLIRLVQALEARTAEREPGRWTLERGLVLPGRKEIASLVRDDGARVSVFYDQAVLPGREHEATRARYLGVDGRARPDITVVCERRDAPRTATVIEVKHSRHPSTLRQGLDEARIYRWEYRDYLVGWPKAILVALPEMAGAPRREDDVIALGWDRWCPVEVVDGLLGMGVAA